MLWRFALHAWSVLVAAMVVAMGVVVATVVAAVVAAVVVVAAAVVVVVGAAAPIILHELKLRLCIGCATRATSRSNTHTRHALLESTNSADIRQSIARTNSLDIVVWRASDCAVQGAREPGTKATYAN